MGNLRCPWVGKGCGVRSRYPPEGPATPHLGGLATEVLFAPVEPSGRLWESCKSAMTLPLQLCICPSSSALRSFEQAVMISILEISALDQVAKFCVWMLYGAWISLNFTGTHSGGYMWSWYALVDPNANSILSWSVHKWIKSNTLSLGVSYVQY